MSVDTLAEDWRQLSGTEQECLVAVGRCERDHTDGCICLLAGDHGEQPARQTVSEALRSLADRGLVDRTTDDRGVVRSTLTERGRRVLTARRNELDRALDRPEGA